MTTSLSSQPFARQPFWKTQKVAHHISIVKEILQSCNNASCHREHGIEAFSSRRTHKINDTVSKQSRWKPNQKFMVEILLENSPWEGSIH